MSQYVSGIFAYHEGKGMITKLPNIYNLLSFNLVNLVYWKIRVLDISIVEMNSIQLIACTLVLTEKIYVHVYADYTCKYVQCAIVSF